MKKQKSILSRIFNHTLLLANIFAVIWLFLCYAASTIHPSEVRYLTLFSLTTPFALAANFFFIFYWLFSSKKLRVILSLLAVGICYEMIPAIFGYHYFEKNDWAKTENSFKLMSWNVHAMGVFNPGNEKEFAQEIVNFIKQENPDILCLPEFSVNVNPNKNKHVRKIINQNNYKEYRFNTDNNFDNKIITGTAFLSKYPIKTYKVYDLSPEIYMLQCDLQLPENILRIFIVHLQSFRLSDEDKEVIEKVKRNDESLDKSKRFIYKFNEAYLQRGKEADKAVAIIRQSPYPTIVCGDFNDLPFSYTYRQIKGDLQDAFAEKGKGFGRTYNQIIPTLRIDHIFYSEETLYLKAFKTQFTHVSDHNPVIANFEIITKPQD